MLGWQPPKKLYNKSSDCPPGMCKEIGDEKDGHEEEEGRRGPCCPHSLQRVCVLFLRISKMSRMTVCFVRGKAWRSNVLTAGVEKKSFFNVCLRIIFLSERVGSMHAKKLAGNSYSEKHRDVSPSQLISLFLGKGKPSTPKSYSLPPNLAKPNQVLENVLIWKMADTGWKLKMRKKTHAGYFWYVFRWP